MEGEGGGCLGVCVHVGGTTWRKGGGRLNREVEEEVSKVEGTVRSPE